MNKTARIQASFSLPEVFLEDKIERMGNNQTKMMMPKREESGQEFHTRGLCWTSIVYNLVSAEVVLVSFKITKRTMRPDMSYIRC